MDLFLFWRYLEKMLKTTSLTPQKCEKICEDALLLISDFESRPQIPKGDKDTQQLLTSFRNPINTLAKFIESHKISPETSDLDTFDVLLSHWIQTNKNRFSLKKDSLKILHETFSFHLAHNSEFRCTQDGKTHFARLSGKHQALKLYNDIAGTDKNHPFFLGKGSFCRVGKSLRYILPLSGALSQKNPEAISPPSLEIKSDKSIALRIPLGSQRDLEVDHESLVLTRISQIYQQKSGKRSFKIPGIVPRAKTVISLNSEGGIRSVGQVQPVFYGDSISLSFKTYMFSLIYQKDGRHKDFLLKGINEMLYGLARAHQAGVVHLDIKGDNIFFNPPGRSLSGLHLADWGMGVFKDLLPELPSVISAENIASIYFFIRPRMPSADLVKILTATNKDEIIEAYKKVDVFALGLALLSLLGRFQPDASQKEKVIVLQKIEGKEFLTDYITLFQDITEERKTELHNKSINNFGLEATNAILSMISGNPDDRPTAEECFRQLNEIHPSDLTLEDD